MAHAQATYFAILLGFSLLGFLCCWDLGCVWEAGKARARLGFGFHLGGWESTGTLGLRVWVHKGRVFSGTGFCTQPLYFINCIVGRKVLPCSHEVFPLLFHPPLASALPRLTYLPAAPHLSRVRLILSTSPCP